MMERNIYNELIKWSEAEHRLPLILKGARQVGKTYAITQFAKKHFTKLHYINFEETPEIKNVFETDLNPNRILGDLRIDFKEVISNRELIFFDEIQACPKAITSLKYFAEKLPEVFICAAGSLLGVILNNESYPVGKVQHLYLTPFKFSEFLFACDPWLYEVLLKVKKDSDASSFHHQKLLDAFRLYAAVGGMPRAVMAAKENYTNNLELFGQLAMIHEDLLRSYHSDFAKHAGKVNAVHISSIFANIPSQLSRNVDGSTKRFIFKDVIPNKKSFAELSAPIDWLVRAGLVYKTKIVNRSEHPLESFSSENLFKLYFFDSGLLGRALNLPYQVIYGEDYGIVKGYFMENAILSQLIVSDLDLPYCWEENKSEVEFVRVINGLIVPIEVKSGYKTYSKSLNSYIKRYSPKCALRLSKNNFVKTTAPIKDMPLYLAEYLREVI